MGMHGEALLHPHRRRSRLVRCGFDPLFCGEAFEFLDGPGLMFQRGVSVAHHHVDLGMSEYGSERNQVDPGFRGSGSEGGGNRTTGNVCCCLSGRDSAGY